MSKAKQSGSFNFASSSSVYGDSNEEQFSEKQSTDRPISLYAASKKMNEILAHSYSHLYKIKVTGLRFFTVYGPWGRPDMAYFKFFDHILRGKKIEVFNYKKMLETLLLLMIFLMEFINYLH